MIIPIPLRGLIVSALAFLTVSPPLTARVGESQDTVERRLLQPSVGKFYSRSKDKDNRDFERERLKEEKDQPFNEAKKYFPSDHREGVYWKSSVAGHLSNDNGWKVHVFFVAGYSVLEAYQRVGDSLSEFEVRALLAINRGASLWKKTSAEEAKNGGRRDQAGGISTNGIGYDYELEDGSLRAKHKGNWLMIFSTRLDGYVVEQQKAAKMLSDREAERNRQEQQNRAPESVMGF